MITKTGERNKYGGFTWKIKLSSEYHILIHETNEKTLIVELKEAFYIKYKTRFTYISNKPMLETVGEAFDAASRYFVEKKNFYWEQLNEKKYKALNDFRRFLSV